MADENTQAPPSSTQADTQKQTVEQEWNKIVEGKFKSSEELAKAYKELENKLGEQGVELGQSREFVETVKPILELVRDDPALFAAVDAKLKQTMSPQNFQQVESQPNKSQEENKETLSNLVIANFEKEYGIDTLPETERRAMRAKIGTAISEMTGMPMNKVDLRRLEGTLKNAYVLANKDNLVEKTKLEALIEAQANEEAGISSLRSSAKNTEEITLTPEQARVAQKMGLTKDQYVEGLRKSSR
jgi:hypothetical protein